MGRRMMLDLTVVEDKAADAEQEIEMLLNGLKGRNAIIESRLIVFEQDMGG